MSIIFNGKNHDKVYFNGKYHDKIYHGSTLVWQKGTPAPPVNLYNPSVVDKQGYITSQPSLLATSTSLTTYCACEPNTTYTITLYRQKAFVVADFAAIPAFGPTCANYVKHPNYWKSPPSTDTLVYTTSATANYIGIYYWESGYGVAADARSTITITKN